MCGIAGIYELRGPGSSELGPVLGRMLDVMAHRGPDDRGQERLENLWLGHLRLSILDLSPRGHQPMSVAGGRLVISYNGEVYNYLELRRELEAMGARFVSDSDTEVILQAYAHWGLDCFQRFNGMWAVAIWDRPSRRLVLCRDRVGIKPLYYCLDGDRLAFASEVKALLAYRRLTKLPLELDQAALETYLRTGLVDGLEEGFFRGVKRLKAGQCMVWEEGRQVATPPYWDLPATALGLRQAQAGRGDEDLAEELRALLGDAMALHTRADVPVGVCLSGGLDSSAVAALVSPHIASLDTFTAWFPEGEEYNELEHAAKVVERYRLNSFPTQVRGEALLDKLPDLLWHLDEPTLAMGVYPQWHVMEEAAKRVTVVMDGQGGDEIFAGYDFYAPRRLYGLLREGRTKEYQQTLAGYAANYGRERADSLGQEVKALFMQDAASQLPEIFPGHLDNMLFQELTVSRLPALLRYEDRLSMAFSIESRVPLLDYRLIEFAFALDEGRKVGPGWSKHLFRQSLSRILPAEVAWRKDKKGFPTPFAVWADQGLREAIRELLLGGRSWLAQALGRQAIEGLFAAWDQGSKDHWTLWRLVSLELWQRTYLARLDHELAQPAGQTHTRPPRVLPQAASPKPTDAGTSTPEPAAPSATEPTSPTVPSLEAVITLDYETFDTDDLLLDEGLAIDWRQDLIAPTERFARLLEEHGAKLTVMWDTAEYFWLQDHGHEQPVAAIREQLTDLVRRGHDVQLHLHPAWTRVEKRGERWLWHQPGLTAPAMAPADFEALVARSVTEMEALFRPIRPDYQVLGYRARGYQVEPFGVIADTLKRHGIRADSSYHGQGPLAVRTPVLTQGVDLAEADFIEYPIFQVGDERWDFSGPEAFVDLPLRALPENPTRGQCLVMIGHCKQRIHYEKIAACLEGLKRRFGADLAFNTWRESIARNLTRLPRVPKAKPGFSPEYFEARWQEDDPFASAQVQDPYYQRLLDLLPARAGSLLDLGAAEGLFTARLAQRVGARLALGVDISATAVERARGRFPHLEFRAADLLAFRDPRRFDLIVSSQNIYYFRPNERAAILANLEAMLSSEGRVVLAWWTGAKRGFQEETIEAEFARFFAIEHAETYTAPPGAAIKESHRILVGRRRLSLAEEDLLGGLHWPGRKVVCLSRRGEDLRQRFAWQCAGWSQDPGAACDVLILDQPDPRALAGLRLNGSLVMADDQADGMEGVLWVRVAGGWRLGARSGSIRLATPAQTSPVPRVAGGAPKEIIFAKLNPQLRIFKQALALKKLGGYKLTLIAVGVDQGLYGGLFDEIITIRTHQELIDLVNQRRPYLYHVHAEPNVLPGLVATHARVPVIYDAYDFAGLRNGVAALPEDERAAERYCLENAAGIVNKFTPEVLDYYRSEGYRISAPVLYYGDYCVDDWLVPISPNGHYPDEWHLVHVGAVAPASYDHEQFRHMQFHDVARILDRQGIHLHIYPNPYQGAREVFGCYDALDRELRCFHFHDPVSPLRLNQEIARYHWGSNLAGHPRPVIRDAVVAIGNKLTSYMESGLPILALDTLRHAAQLVDDLGAGLSLGWGDLEHLDGHLRRAYSACRAGVERARRDFSISHHGHRLAEFYRQVAG